MKKKRVETFRNIRYVASPDRKIAPVVRLGWLAPARQLYVTRILHGFVNRILHRFAKSVDLRVAK